MIPAAFRLLAAKLSCASRAVGFGQTPSPRHATAHLDRSAALDAAIRAGDRARVARLLAGRTRLGYCTIDHEGYHTPLELARTYGDQAIVDMLEQSVRRR